MKFLINLVTSLIELLTKSKLQYEKTCDSLKKR